MLFRSLSKQIETPIRSIGIEDKTILLVSTEKESLKQGADYIIKELKLHQTVVKTFVCAEIPLTANGKPDYKSLQKMYEER